MEKQVVEVRGVRIGEGRSKICVPVTSRSMNHLKEDLRLLEMNRDDFDLIEWRADCFEVSDNLDIPAVSEAFEIAMKMIRGRFETVPLLFTYRTKPEGGRGISDGKEYGELLLRAAASGIPDLIDIELFTAKTIPEGAASFIGKLHALRVKVIGSSHDFEKTPDENELYRRLEEMQRIDMDITKLAVMPRCRADAARLIFAAAQMEEERSDRPCVTISMGPAGVLSRVSGPLTGSAITFGTCGPASAPGQIPAKELKMILDALEVNTCQYAKQEGTNGFIC